MGPSGMGFTRASCSAYKNMNGVMTPGRLGGIKPGGGNGDVNGPRHLAAGLALSRQVPSAGVAIPDARQVRRQCHSEAPCNKRRRVRNVTPCEELPRHTYLLQVDSLPCSRRDTFMMLNTDITSA